tara:strand:+ start:1738 stop:2394 length:657 start_codon:yes stop_codon:yes gene_type:complete
MALVRISKELLIAVSHQVQDVTAKATTLQIEPMHPKVTSELLAELKEKVVTHVWGAHIALRSQIPEAWKVKGSEVNVSLLFAGNLVTEGIKVNEKFDFPPNTRVSYDQVDVKLPIVDGLAADFAKKHIEYKIALNAHLAKYKEVAKQIEKFLKEAKSLNDALKRFPDLALYIPKTFLDRIELKVEREVKEVEYKYKVEGPEMDRDLVVSTGIIGALIK